MNADRELLGDGDLRLLVSADPRSPGSGTRHRSSNWSTYRCSTSSNAPPRSDRYQWFEYLSARLAAVLIDDDNANSRTEAATAVAIVDGLVLMRLLGGATAANKAAALIIGS